MDMKKMLLGLALVLCVAMWSPAALLAGEHGGEHGGAAPADGEHGGAAVEGSHGHMDKGSHHEMMADHIATLKEAAKVLKQDGHAELAAELESMAEMKEKKMEKKKD